GRIAGLMTHVRQSHDKVREVALIPILAPFFDNRWEAVFVAFGPAGVMLALVPDRTLDRERDERGDHAVVELRFPRVFALVVRVGVERLQAGPLFRRGAAPGGVNDPHRHIQVFLQVTAEVVRDGGEPANSVGSGLDPDALPLVLVDGDCRLRLFRGGPLYGEKPQLRVRGVLLRLLRAGAAVDRHFHVRLPAGDPDLSDVDVFYFDFVFSFHGQRVRPVRGDKVAESGQFDVPFAVFVGGRLNKSRTVTGVERDGDLFAGVGRAPDVARLALLEDHAVGKQRVRFHIGAGGVGI